jgi:hypothetical protein
MASSTVSDPRWEQVEQHRRAALRLLGRTFPGLADQHEDIFNEVVTRLLERSREQGFWPETLQSYLLGAVTAWLSFLLLRHRDGQRCRSWWAIAFAALALAAFLGGTWHGFVQSDLLWKATTLSVGAAAFAMVVASAFAASSGAARKLLIAFAVLKLAVYTGWMLEHDQFIYVVIDTGAAFALVAVLHVWKWNALLLAGVAVSVLGAIVQASGFALHRHFNHNDLYHVIQIAAIVLFYRGARGLRDA